MKIVITYGTYDFLHYGHIRLLQRAKALGDYLIVGVTSDAFDRQRGKLNVQQTLSERMDAVRETGLADLIIAEEYEGQKIADIQKFGADIFAIGSDWNGKFDYLNKYCKVIYLERTKGVSSTEIRANKHAIVKLGCIGMNIPTNRILAESRFVSGLEITSCYRETGIPHSEHIDEAIQTYDIVEYDSYEQLLECVDAVYIAASRKNNETYIRKALSAGKHVLCESPIFLHANIARELFDVATSKKRVLMEAVKTLYFPAFQHLILLIASRVIGDVVHIDVSCSQNVPALDYNNKYEGSMYDFGTYCLLPVFKLLGTDFKHCSLKNYYEPEYDFCKFTTCFLEYSNATATIKAGKGIKTEGELIITGTNGYIYVPAPWWKTEYFEIRHEDLRNTKKYFYQYAGEGLRYELGEFINQINNPGKISNWGIQEWTSVSKIMESFEKQVPSDG